MCVVFFFLMIRRPPRSTLDRSSAASDVYKRQGEQFVRFQRAAEEVAGFDGDAVEVGGGAGGKVEGLSLIHISEPTKPY